METDLKIFTSLIENCGFIVYILKSLIVDRSNAGQLTHVALDNLGPGKYRTQADSGTEKMCYYNRNKKRHKF